MLQVDRLGDDQGTRTQKVERPMQVFARPVRGSQPAEGLGVSSQSGIA